MARVTRKTPTVELSSLEMRDALLDAGYRAIENWHNRIGFINSKDVVEWGPDPDRQGRYEGFGIWLVNGVPARTFGDVLKGLKAPKPLPKKRRKPAGLADAVKKMRLYLGSVDFASVRVQQRLYTSTMKAVEKVADKAGLELVDAWDQIAAEATRLGPVRPTPGKDI